MQFSTLNETPQSRSMVNVFGGYSKKNILSDGEFSDLENMCLDDYPLIENRQKRGGDAAYIDRDGTIVPFKDNVINGFRSNILYQNGITTFARDSIVIDNKRVTTSSLVKGNSKYNQIVESGGYLFLLPQYKVVNKIDNSVEDIDFSQSKTDFIMLYSTDFENLENPVGEKIFFGENYPNSPESGTYFVNTKNEPRTLEIYVATVGMWIPVNTVLLRIKATETIKNMFNDGDSIFLEIDGTSERFSGFESKEYIIKKVEKIGSSNTVNLYIDLDGFVPKKSYGERYTSGNSTGIRVSSTSYKIKRTHKEIDYAVGHNNRIWGCKYGETDDGFVNEIYATKLGDFKNWSSFAGTLADSYAASVGSEGEWTGVTTYNGYILFFKERFMHRIYGDNPSNFQIQEIPCDGVMKGASGSLAIIDGVLYYLSKRGVMAYDGSVPQCISDNFGRGIFKKLPSEIDTVNYHISACGFRNKYIISMVHTGCSEKNYIWEYDTRLGTWCRSEETNAVSLCAGQDNVYYYDCDENSVKMLYGDEEDAITWYVQTGNLGLDSPDKKYINRLDVRMSLTVGSHAMFYIEYDSSDKWEHVATVKGTRLKTFSLPIKPKRCDHFRLRIQGEGDVKLYSITKTFEEGSDL